MRRVLELLNSRGEVLRRAVVFSNSHRKKFVKRWRKLYGRKFDSLVLKETNAHMGSNKIKKQDASFEKLHTLINESGKELNKLEAQYLSAISDLRNANHKLIELEDDSMIDFKEIDFGVGKLYYKIEPGGAVTVSELMQAIKDVSLIVPLTRIIDAVKRTNKD